MSKKIFANDKIKKLENKVVKTVIRAYRHLKNMFYTVCFMFRPITTVAVSFAFLVLSSILLIIVVLWVEENTKVYEISLAILTGITSSFLISIIMELYNNYRFNCRRQRELREYFNCVSEYEIRQFFLQQTNNKYITDDSQSSGRTYSVFCQLKEIIPQLRQVLNHRDYLYRLEIEAIDDILYYCEDLIKIIYIHLFPTYLHLIYAESDASNEINSDENNDDGKLELAEDYPKLFYFLKEEANYYIAKYDTPNSDDKVSEYFMYVIEKAIFDNRHILTGYFEVTDDRSFKKEIAIYEESNMEESLHTKQSDYDNRSDWISYFCSNIDKTMIKLQKRAAKEPYIWEVAGYKIDEELLAKQ